MATVDVTRFAASLPTLNVYPPLQGSRGAVATQQTRLASGLRLTAAADDVAISPAGLARQQAQWTAPAGSTSVQDLLAQLRAQAAAAEAAAVTTSGTDQGGQAASASASAPPEAAAGPAGTTLESIRARLGMVGARIARLSDTEGALATQPLNTEAAYTRIMNANMAEEQLNASKYMILQQTATAMLAQANQAPQNLLQLFR